MALHLKDISQCLMQIFTRRAAMNTIENLPTAARHSICLALAVFIVTAALTLGAFGANAEYQSAQRAQVTVEVA
jgi:hypothetical protein